MFYLEPTTLSLPQSKLLGSNDISDGLLDGYWRFGVTDSFFTNFFLQFCGI